MSRRYSRDSRSNVYRLLRSKIRTLTEQKNWLTCAAYWTLESMLHQERDELEQVDYCKARAYLSLALFYKESHELEKAAEYYEKAAELMLKHPNYSKGAKLQLANAFDCKARSAMHKKNYTDASKFFLQSSKLYEEIGKHKEANYSKLRAYESQAHQQAMNGEYLAASKTMETAAEIMREVDEKLYFSSIADSYIYKALYSQKNSEYKQAAEYFNKAAEYYSKARNEKLYFRTQGRAIQSLALHLRYTGAPYSDISCKFREAAEYYLKASDYIPALVCKADAEKFEALEAKRKALWEKALKHLQNGKQILQQLLKICSREEERKKYQNGILWFEATAVETLANKKLLESILKKESMEEVTALLTHAGELFTSIGDMKHATINSTFTLIAMAIEAFHNGDIIKANNLIQEAKSLLPRDFAFRIFTDKIDEGWEPLRYTLDMIKSFDNYARKIEMEKGFSFESRIRELLRKMYPEYRIEAKYFNPEHDEIGIVFKDKTPIEIDALGERIHEDRYRLLVAEIKNISKPVEKHEILKFIRKIKFERRDITR